VTIKGMCLCEKVRYEISSELGPIFNCHCSKCRRWHGAAFRTRASIKAEHFKIVAGANEIAAFDSSEKVTKHFCRTCGSNLHSTYADRPDLVGIPLGALEGVEQKPEGHIFTEFKASWYDITDALPQFPQWPGSIEKVRATKS